MNYIVLSESVYESIAAQYEKYCKMYDYTMTADVYMDNLILYENVCRLYNRSWNGDTYAVIGKKCILYTEKHQKLHDALYAKKIRFFEEDSTYLSKLSQTIALPGEWEIVRSRDVWGLPVTPTEPLDGILAGLKGSYQEQKTFEEKWKTWDIYNTSLKQLEEQKELDSQTDIKSVVLENDLFIMEVSEWKKQYQTGAAVSAIFSGQKQPVFIGKIEEVIENSRKLFVRCTGETLAEQYLAGTTGSILKLRITDYGAKARLKRQSEALKRLFEEETANPHLKEILMGDYAFDSVSTQNVELSDIYTLFGTNIGQKQAFAGAVNANDIYLIQGPPGTGKTTIITEIVKYAIKNHLKVLVSSETHTAVDNVLEKVCRMKGVIPVRLGREERINGVAKDYMPGVLAQQICQRAKEIHEQHSRAEMKLDEMLQGLEADYIKAMQEIQSEIEKRKLQIPVEKDYDTLFARIEKFEQTVTVANELYDELVRQKDDYFRLTSEKAALQAQINKQKAQLYVAETGSMASGFRESDARSSAALSGNHGELKEICEQLERISDKLSENTYEIRKGSYERKLKRAEKYRSKLAEQMGGKIPSMSMIYQIKTAFTEMAYFQTQSEQLTRQKQDAIDRCKREYMHKKELWERSADIRAEWKEQLSHNDVKSCIQDIYMKQTNAVFATCTGIASSDNGFFADMEYDYVIIDEAAKCNMLDLLIPMILGRKLILVGDHKQLYPVIETGEIREELSPEQIDLLKNHILFKWLYEERIPDDYKMMLNRQYRMTPVISRFVSEQFYSGQLICEKQSDTENALFWIDCEDSAEEKRGTSYINIPEAEVVVRLLKKLDKSCAKGTTAGVICIYKAQADEICKMMGDISFENIEPECSTVDAFQGKEKHTVIFNLGRSLKATAFAADENRTNVAVSRAQEVLYVVGNSDIVKSKDAGVLRRLYEYIRKYGEISSSRYIDS